MLEFDLFVSRYVIKKQLIYYGIQTGHLNKSNVITITQLQWYTKCYKFHNFWYIIQS